MNQRKRMIHPVLIGTLTATLVACGGSSGTSDTSETTDNQVNDQAGIEQNAPTPVADNTPYQTGFVLSEIQSEIIATGVTSTIRFETDTQNNTITDNITANIYSDVIYDEQGAAISVDDQLGSPATLTYNDDGTIARAETVRDSVIRFAEFEYEAGNLVVRRSGRTENGVTRVSRRYDYIYSATNALVGANEFVGDNDTPQWTYELATDANGNVTDVSAFSSPGELTRRVVNTYDENSNLVKEEVYGSNGVLGTVTNYAYVRSQEPAPNYISLVSALTGDWGVFSVGFGDIL